jgi:hypothetical protein
MAIKLIVKIDFKRKIQLKKFISLILLNNYSEIF